MGIDNLADPRAELKQMRRAAAVQGTANPGGNTSVSEGAFEIRSTEGLIVSGSAKVSGTLSVTGTETVAGTLGVTGTTNLTGPTNLTGTTKLTGDTTQQGPFHVQGATDLTGNLSVNSPGKITVAGGVPMTIGQLGSGIGGITWGTAFPSLYSDGSQVAIGAGSTNYVAAGTSGPGIRMGSMSISIDGTSPLIAGLGSSGLAANLVVDSSNRLYKSSSALRFKKNIHTVEHDPRLLSKVRVVLFDDINTDAKNIPGVIGEVVAKNGGENYVRRDSNGKVETVAYDRLALVRTELLATENAKLRTEMSDLRADLDALRAQVAAMVQPAR